MNITVYLGASSGNDPTLETSVRALGRLIGKSGNALVYGGSKNGLMGALAESVLRAGGEVTDMGLSTPERQEGIYFAETLDDIRAILKI